MTTKSLHTVRLGACAAWLAVAGYGVFELGFESGDDWQLAYTVFMVALTVGAALTFALLTAASRGSSRRPLRMVGLAVAGLGVAAAFVGAWALPLWMTILAAGFGLTALASDGSTRRALAFLAAAQVVGVAVHMTTLQLGVNENPASGLALIVTSVAMTLGVASGFRHLAGDHVDRPTAAHGAAAA